MSDFDISEKFSSCNHQNQEFQDHCNIPITSTHKNTSDESFQIEIGVQSQGELVGDIG
jgi:hypothetical protein